MVIPRSRRHLGTSAFGGARSGHLSAVVVSSFWPGWAAMAMATGWRQVRRGELVSRLYLLERVQSTRSCATVRRLSSHVCPWLMARILISDVLGNT